MFNGNNKLPIVLAAGVGIWACYYLYKRYKYHYVPPKEWRKIGELSDIICYPIKSCGPVRVKSASCTKLGLSDGNLRDRVFMVVNVKDGKFVTARQYPKMVKIQPKIEGNTMTLSAPGMMDVELDFVRLYFTWPIMCSVWDQMVEAVDCGEDVARWFSRYILDEDFGLRLVFYAKESSMRNVRPCNKSVDTTLKEDTGAFHDATSFMILNESSLMDLNESLNVPVNALNFRPNFVVKGLANPYEEDYWKWVKIGDVVFRSVKPCTRCIFTNIDPKTALRSEDGNPLNMLKKYRMFPKIGNSPVLGTHLGLRKPGDIKVGDEVFVEACRLEIV